MTRLFIDGLSEQNGLISLDKKTAHYVSNVLRLSDGNELVVFDGSGNEYVCSISQMNDKVLLRIIESRESDRTPKKDIILLQGLLKGQKMDLVVQKATEVGVKKIIPVVTGRSQIRKTSKVPRWQTIAQEASRQCGRADIVNVEEAVSFETLLSNEIHAFRDSLKIVFYERSEEPIYLLEKEIQTADSIVLFLGPEGGFHEHEIHKLRDKGFHVTGLGDFILRAETAAIVASGIVQYIIGKTE
jgi:16S rRNA (uracil1498-N3)-methyltransferase